MGDDVLDFVRGDAVAGEEFFGHLREDPGGELEDFAAVLVELVLGARMTGPPQGRHPAVGAEDVVHEAGLAGAALEDHRARAVAEEHRSRAFLGIHDFCHRVRPDE